MTTPSPDFGGTAAGSRLLGGNDLQSALDNLTTAVKSLTAAVQASSSKSPGGTSVPFGSTGQTFTSGSFPKMTSAAMAFGGGGANYATGPGGGSGATGNPASTTQSAMGSLGDMATSAMTGGSQFSNQILMNQMASQSTLMMGPGNVGQGNSSRCTAWRSAPSVSQPGSAPSPKARPTRRRCGRTYRALPAA